MCVRLRSAQPRHALIEMPTQPCVHFRGDAGKKGTKNTSFHPRLAHTCLSHVWVVVEWDASPRWQHEDSHGKRRLLSKVYISDLPR